MSARNISTGPESIIEYQKNLPFSNSVDTQPSYISPIFLSAKVSKVQQVYFHRRTSSQTSPVRFLRRLSNTRETFFALSNQISIKSIENLHITTRLDDHEVSGSIIDNEISFLFVYLPILFII
jgi:hypothetical protein